MIQIFMPREYLTILLKCVIIKWYGDEVMRVGLFDSGIGGLTVLKTLTMKYPNNDY